MKCDICGKNEATVHLTEVVNEKVTKFHLCEECAKKKSEEMQSHFGLTDLLSGLMDFEPALKEQQVQKDTGLKCPGCDMSYYDFQKTGRLGCGKCYQTFSKKLGLLLKKIHGSDRHLGKMPFGGHERLKEKEQLKRMRQELRELVDDEEFEKAAVIRDRIKEMGSAEQKGEKSDDEDQ